jgi:hypothetical protein
LQAIFYETLVYTFKHTGPAAEINISIQPTGRLSLADHFFRIQFQRVSCVSRPAMTKAMAASIGVIIYADSTADQLDMDVPITIEVSRYIQFRRNYRIRAMRRERVPDLAVNFFTTHTGGGCYGNGKYD